MKFLVILICLALNHFWLRDYDRFDDRWFFRLRGSVESTSGRVFGNAAAWQPALALVYALPLIALWLVLGLVGDSLFGLPAMLVHILVVLVAFDRVQPGKLAGDFIALWNQGDREALAEFLRRSFPSAPAAVEQQREFADDGEAAHFFRKHLVHRCFERMFALFFWYIAAGPAGVLVSYVSYQLRDSHDQKTHPRMVETVEMIVQLLEWIPLRLLALTFSLAGNFTQCFAQLRKSFWEFGREVDNASLLYGFAGFALFGGIPRQEEGETTDSSRQVHEIESLQALLTRCQLLWLGLLAVATIFSPAI